MKTLRNDCDRKLVIFESDEFNEENIKAQTPEWATEDNFTLLTSYNGTFYADDEIITGGKTAYFWERIGRGPLGKPCCDSHPLKENERM